MHRACRETIGRAHTSRCVLRPCGGGGSSATALNGRACLFHPLPPIPSTLCHANTRHPPPQILLIFSHTCADAIPPPHQIIANTGGVLGLGGTPHEVLPRPGRSVVDVDGNPFNGPKTPSAKWHGVSDVQQAHSQVVAQAVSVCVCASRNDTHINNVYVCATNAAPNRHHPAYCTRAAVLHASWCCITMSSSQGRSLQPRMRAAAVPATSRCASLRVLFYRAAPNLEHPSLPPATATTS